ncbi:hypothetical protein A2U01_0076837, partial [Trifolium medium]|nr:hypothetical protein [Trifolium medium]
MVGWFEISGEEDCILLRCYECLDQVETSSEENAQMLVSFPE